ncbi:MAG: pyridoxal 5-phosphate synthase pdxT subunit [Actinomycetota bacterium]|nr:pyridoxal 5-phosphate synthase pdxT subunit [Actinomycetota bacterium]
MSSSQPRIGVLAVQGDVREHAAALRGCGADVRRVRRARELDDLDGLVIPGGESTTMDKLVRAFDLRDPLLKLLADGLPAFGSCAGMIMLADRVQDAAPGQQALGGIDMTVRRNAFGRQVDSFEADLRLTGVEGPCVRGIFIRAPWVESVGGTSRSLPRSSTGRPQVGSSRCGRETCWRPRSTRRSPGTPACTASSSRWSATPQAER